MQIPAFAKNGNNGSPRLNKGLNVVVVFNLAVLGMRGAPKSCNAGMLQRQLGNTLEESHVFEVRPGPAAFNIVNAKLIELVRNVQLVINRKRDVLALGTVAQRC